GRTTLAAVCDEEIYSAGTHHFLSKSKNDFTAALFSEPSFSDRIRAINQVPGRFAFDISVIGKSAHGATGLGTNAIVEASRLIGQINGIKLGRHPLMGAGSINIGSIESGSKFLSVPEECTFRLDRCTVAGETMAKAKGEVLEAAKKAGLLAKPIIKPIKRPTPFIPAGMTSPSSPLGLAIKKAFRQNQTKLIYGKVDSTFDMGYAVDAGIPSFSIGPVGGNLHAAEEYVLISSIEKCYSIYLDILKNL
ncbi:M20/M25/M40 family metallo-hydrolase, partial [Candidatus Parvarchaeota archaeon]|nr:M20/M25/M40 family metallo-hydrolase [Candidatus Parvarchaeota archaeon]